MPRDFEPRCFELAVRVVAAAFRRRNQCVLTPDLQAAAERYGQELAARIQDEIDDFLNEKGLN